METAHELLCTSPLAFCPPPKNQHFSFKGQAEKYIGKQSCKFNVKNTLAKLLLQCVDSWKLVYALGVNDRPWAWLNVALRFN